MLFVFVHETYVLDLVHEIFHDVDDQSRGVNFEKKLKSVLLHHLLYCYKNQFFVTFVIRAYCIRSLFERAGSKECCDRKCIEHWGKRAQNVSDLSFIRNDLILSRYGVYIKQKWKTMLMVILAIFEIYGFQLRLKIWNCLRRCRNVNSGELFPKLWSSVCHIVYYIVCFS